MSGDGVPVRAAAKVLRHSPGTIRRWIRSGAPCVSHGDGQGGRGRGSLVDPAQLERWYTSQLRLRSGSATRGDDLLGRLAQLLREFHRAKALDDIEAHHLCGITPDAAAKYLILLFRYCYVQENGRPPREGEYPDCVKSLIASTDGRVR